MFDRRVCILEQHTTIGGLNSYYRQNRRNYDVGLHAVTNFTPKGARRGPLARVLRQLRIAWDELQLVPQTRSTIRFPDTALDFSNDFELFASEVERAFPSQGDGLRRLVAELADYEHFTESRWRGSARQWVQRFLDDPLLIEMIFCPLLYYGSARENDMELGQFSIMFRSIFLEGLARPAAGVRVILKRLVRKYKSVGGELRLRGAVRRIAVRNGAVDKVVLEDGRELETRSVLSSAGWPETLALCDEAGRPDSPPVGALSFIESISILDTQPAALGHDQTIVFFNDSPEFHYERPDDLADLRSGVVCSPNNFAYDEPLDEGVVRITALANYGRWAALDERAYRSEKNRWYHQMVGSAVRFVPDFRNAVVDHDMFTPTTIRHYTRRAAGAVYGAPDKRYDGTTHLKNLFLCGTDQGFVGIVGATVSGISVANRYLLKEEGRRKREE